MINTIILGHTLNILPELPSGSVSCVTTSPPYWGLRDYDIEPVIWDGDKDCEHIWRGKQGKAPNNSEAEKKDDKWKSFRSEKYLNQKQFEPTTQFCQLCGAWKGSLGLEPTFELYIKHLCDIFDEVKRVLRKDGTCWVNLGDSYVSGKSRYNSKEHTISGKSRNEPDNHNKPDMYGLYEDKCLALIPQRFVIEMVNRGWILRNIIIWHKKNCMPSSANDRFTVDFEYVYFFVKSKRYWFEQQFQPIAKATIKRSRNKFYPDNPKTKLWYSTQKEIKPGRDAQTFNQEVYKKIASGEKVTANKRAVWTIPTQSFPEAHFAVYPEGLIEIPIKAGCPEFVCKKCGKARIKIYEDINNRHWTDRQKKTKKGMFLKETGQRNDLGGSFETKETKFIGYSDCGCNAGWESGIVLDPFMGAGTSALVALKQRKRFIGIEIKQEYIDMTKRRIAKVQQRIF